MTSQKAGALGAFGAGKKQAAGKKKPDHSLAKPAPPGRTALRVAEHYGTAGAAKPAWQQDHLGVGSFIACAWAAVPVRCAPQRRARQRRRRSSCCCGCGCGCGCCCCRRCY
jgi:hypothetical protein